MFDSLSTYNEGDFIVLGNWGPFWLTIFALLALLIVGLTWVDLSGMSRSRRIVLTGLRLVTLSFAIFLLTEPAVELRDVTRVPNNVPILVDTSQSAQLPADASGRTRAERSIDQVERAAGLLRTSGDDHIFTLRGFSETSAPLSPNQLSTDDFDGATTDILTTLQDLEETWGTEGFGGAVLISDGTDTEALGERVSRDQDLDAESLAYLRSLGAPIHTVATADEEGVRDIAIRRVIHDDFAFVRNAVTIEVELEVLGFNEGAVPVTLYRGSETLQQREVQIEEGVSSYLVEFEFVPELIGKEVYSVSTPLREGDAVPENNADFFVLKVIRDRIRVLQVVGRPSWDVRFLRQLLKENPNVELISFFILRTNEDLQRAPQSELALIPFPTDELFREQLGSFDLVIMQNFTYVPYNMRQYLPRIRDYVEGGGGFAMIGGEQSFASGGYAGTEIAEMLPVQLPPGGSADSLVDPAPFRPQLTSAGSQHPITRIEFDRAANETMWGDLPELPGTNVVGEARDEAIVLAEHPRREAGGSPMPVLSVMNYGDGRSLALTVDGSWRWNYEAVLEGGNSRPYSSFWNSAIRWLIRDPALNLIQVEIQETRVKPASPVSISVRVFNPDYSPAANTEVRMRARRAALRSGEELDFDADAQSVIEETLTTDTRGRAQWTIAPEQAGAWRVEAIAAPPGSEELRDDEVFLSLARSDELREVRPRNDLLRAISTATGGEHLEAPASLSRLEFAPARLERINRRQIVELWSSPWALIALLLLVALEWQLRRSWGRL